MLTCATEVSWKSREVPGQCPVFSQQRTCPAECKWMSASFPFWAHIRGAVAVAAPSYQTCVALSKGYKCLDRGVDSLLTIWNGQKWGGFFPPSSVLGSHSWWVQKNNSTTQGRLLGRHSEWRIASYINSTYAGLLFFPLRFGLIINRCFGDQVAVHL